MSQGDNEESFLYYKTKTMSKESQYYWYWNTKKASSGEMSIYSPSEKKGHKEDKKAQSIVSTQKRLARKLKK